jgi:hypothetical protein
LFALAHQAADDFFEIVLVAVLGYGFGALKLLRPLFERVVDALYLLRHPEETQDYNDYADVDTWRLINHATDTGTKGKGFITDKQLDEARNAYERAKPRFMATGAKRERGSWARMDLAARARDVGLGTFYGGGAFWPTMLLHTTRLGLEMRLDASANGLAFTHRPEPAHADRALAYAHILLVQLVVKCNAYFGWAIDTATLIDDVEKCWAGFDAR